MLLGVQLNLGFGGSPAAVTYPRTITTIIAMSPNAMPGPLRNFYAKVYTEPETYDFTRLNAMAMPGQKYVFVAKGSAAAGVFVPYHLFFGEMN